jgi:hypothetical protein
VHFGAFRGERLADLLAKTAAASGDENGFAFSASSRKISMLIIARPLDMMGSMRL